MRGRGTAARTAGRRAWILAVAASAVLHLVLLGWFALKRGVGEPGAEAPTVVVQLIRPLPPLTPDTAPPAAAPGPPQARAAVVPTDVAPRYVAAPPEARGAGNRRGLDLFGPVFADGRWPRPEDPILTRCDPLKDPRRESRACRHEDDIARAVTAANDPQNGRDEFAREGRRNEAVRRYRELPGTAGDPGFACQVLHRC